MENSPTTTGSQKRQNALQLGPWKKPYVSQVYVRDSSIVIRYLHNRCGSDPLVHHGRHFGRTVHALCTISALLNNGILRMVELADRAEETFTHEYVLASSMIFIFTMHNSYYPSENGGSTELFDKSLRWYQDSKNACWRARTRTLGI